MHNWWTHKSLYSQFSAGDRISPRVPTLDRCKISRLTKAWNQPRRWYASIGISHYDKIKICRQCHDLDKKTPSTNDSQARSRFHRPGTILDTWVYLIDFGSQISLFHVQRTHLLFITLTTVIRSCGSHSISRINTIDINPPGRDEKINWKWKLFICR